MRSKSENPVNLMTFDLELSQRRALVTGGTKGIGAAVVDVLKNTGVKVLATARSLPVKPLDGVRYIEADVSTAGGCAKVARSVLEQLGGIDIIVKVAGGSSGPGGGVAPLDDHELAKRIDLNLISTVRLDRALLPAPIASRAGVILHVT